MTKGRNIKNYFVKSQPLFDVHRQYLWMFLINLQAEVSRFRCRIFFTVLLIFSKFSSIIIGFIIYQLSSGHCLALRIISKQPFRIRFLDS